MDHLKSLVKQTRGMNIDEIRTFYKTKYKCKVNVKLPLFTPMYTYKTNFDKLGSLATRGTVFALNDQGIFYGEIVCVPFFKFFNKGQNYAPDTDELVVKSIQRKYDGSLIKVFKYRDEWIIASNGTSIADDKFQKLFERAIGKPASEFNEIFDDMCIYVFELCTPDNEIKIKHKDFKATLLLTRCRITWDELPNVATPLYPIAEELEAFDFNEDHQEGVVIVYECGQRVKCKTLWYMFLYQLGDDQHITEEKQVDKAIQQGFFEYVIELCSEEMKEYAKSFYISLQILEDDVGDLLSDIEDIDRPLEHKMIFLGRKIERIEAKLPLILHKSAFDILYGKTSTFNLRNKQLYEYIKSH